MSSLSLLLLPTDGGALWQDRASHTLPEEGIRIRLPKGTAGDASLLLGGQTLAFVDGVLNLPASCLREGSNAITLQLTRCGVTRTLPCEGLLRCDNSILPSGFDAAAAVTALWEAVNALRTSHASTVGALAALQGIVEGYTLFPS